MQTAGERRPSWWQSPRALGSIGLSLLVALLVALVGFMLLPADAGIEATVLSVVLEVLLIGALAFLLASIVTGVVQRVKHPAGPATRLVREPDAAAAASVAFILSFAAWPAGPPWTWGLALLALVGVVYAVRSSRRRVRDAVSRDIPGWTLLAAPAVGLALTTLLVLTLGLQRGWESAPYPIGLVASSILGALLARATRQRPIGYMLLALLGFLGSALMFPIIWFTMAFSGVDLA